MKKYLSFLVTGFLFLSLEACNNNSNTVADSKNTNPEAIRLYNLDWIKKDAMKVCEKAGGFANFYVSEADGLRMTGDFNNLYKKDGSGKPIDAIENNFWVSTCTVSEITAYLKKNKHDGVRIYMGCDLNPDVIRYPDPPYQNRTIAFLFPTNYDATIVDPKKSQHVTDRKSVLHNEPCAAKSPYFKDFTIAKPMIDKFNDLYRYGKDAFSQSVWIDSCVFNALEALLTANPATNDGALIKLAAYKKGDPFPTRRVYDNQSTVLIIPSKPDGSGGHLPDWTLVDNIHAIVKAYAPPGGFNHGELCPQKCD